MKSIFLFPALVVGCFTPKALAHVDIDWHYPLIIQCEQLDHKQNQWTTRHLFTFEQDGNPNFHDWTWTTGVVKGNYKSHVYVNPPGEEKEFRSNEVEGVASFEATNIHDLFYISAMGYLKGFDDQSGIPQIVVGADVELGKDAATDEPLASKFNVMLKTVRLMALTYSSQCRQITAEEAARF
jgi:hypothetical protein